MEVYEIMYCFFIPLYESFVGILITLIKLVNNIFRNKNLIVNFINFHFHHILNNRLSYKSLSSIVVTHVCVQKTSF